MSFVKKYKTAFILICILVVAIAAGGAFSKYKESIELNEVSLTVASGNLADEFTLQEHEAVQNSDGTYSLGTGSVTSNSYQALPGVTLPKDPFINVVGKSKVPAYLYVEVVDGLGTSGLSYSLNSNWQNMSLTGAKGGKVYVYTGGSSTPALLEEDFSKQDIYILKDNQITVNEENKDSLNVNITFYAYLGQASLAETAKDVYTICFGGGM